MHIICQARFPLSHFLVGKGYLSSKAYDSRCNPSRKFGYNRHYLIRFVLTLLYLMAEIFLLCKTPWQGVALFPGSLSPCLGTRLEREGALLTEQCSSENSLWVSVFTLQVACSAFGLQLDIHWWIAIILPLVIVCCWIRDWDDLASFSMIGNLCIVFSLVVIVGEEIHRLVSNNPADMAAIKSNATNVTVNFGPKPALGLALYFGSVVYAFEGIGVVSVNHKITCSIKLSRGKTFANFKVLWLFAKVFSIKFGGVSSFGAPCTSEQSAKFSPRKSLIHESFLPQKFPAIR